MEKTKTKPSFSAGLPKGMSAYPDMRMAIAMLKKRVESLPPERQMVVNKWINQLEKIQAEMNHLRRIEQFTDNVTTHLNEQQSERLSEHDSQELNA